MIEESLYQHLNDIAELNGNIFPNLIQQDVNEDFLIYKIIYDQDVETLGSVIGSNVRFQLDIYAKTYVQVKFLRDKVKEKLYSFEYKPRNMKVMDGFGDDIEFFRQIIDFNFKL